MPCDTIQTSRVAWKDTTDPKLLKGALESLGYTVTETATGLTFYNRDTGAEGTYRKTILTIRSSYGVDESQEQVKRAYSEQVVQVAARSYGWTLRKQTNSAGNTQYAVARRY